MRLHTLPNVQWKLHISIKAEWKAKLLKISNLMPRSWRIFRLLRAADHTLEDSEIIWKLYIVTYDALDILLFALFWWLLLSENQSHFAPAFCALAGHEELKNCYNFLSSFPFAHTGPFVCIKLLIYVRILYGEHMVSHVSRKTYARLL